MSANSSDSLSQQDALTRIGVLKILESNWQAEICGYHTYETLADRETDPVRRGAFRSLASAEKQHADLWAGRIRVLQGSDPIDKGSTTGEADTITYRAGGVGTALRRLELDESRDTPIRQPLKRDKPLIGSENGFLYSAQVPAGRPAADYTPRLISQHNDASIPLEAAFILWHDSPAWRRPI